MSTGNFIKIVLSQVLSRQTIGKCIPRCENTRSSTIDCDQSCIFYNCGLQFEQDIIATTSETILKITLTVEGRNQDNCFCDTYSGTCYEGFNAFQESEEVKQMKDVAIITLSEIGKLRSILSNQKF